jgi:3-hydroxyacyl-CoA dehydrogenase/3a,7a,12a-trihydroxy-5b-cholest-24-enoyl-CoA hydratase
MMRVFLEKGEGKDLVPKVDAVFNFQIKKTKEGAVVKSFVIDLKNKLGKVRFCYSNIYKGLCGDR